MRVTVRWSIGRLQGAGTSSSVYVNVVGAGGDSGRRSLAAGPGHFERGNEDVFALPLPANLGTIMRVEVRAKLHALLLPICC